MDIFYEIKPGLLKNSTLALGFFDGVHLGHQVVIRKATEEAKRLKSTPAVVTFKEHPRTLTLGKCPPLLTTFEQRMELFADIGVALTLVLSFSEELCQLSPADYVKQVLVECMGVTAVSIGYNHRFGRDREGDPQLLQDLGYRFGFTVYVNPGVIYEGAEVSSSRIRTAIQEGNPELVRQLLARPYALLGLVGKGSGRGQTLGFPTANLKCSEIQVYPRVGVYAGVARLDSGQKLPCIINIGYRPTFGEDDPLTVEVHIFDFDQDLYGQRLVLEFWHFVRPEMKFDSADQLRCQIMADCQAVRNYAIFRENLFDWEERLPA